MSFTTRPMDRDKAETDLALHIKKATSAEETAPKQKHVRGKHSSGFLDSTCNLKSRGAELSQSQGKK